MKVIAYLEEGDVRILLVYEADLDGCRSELQEAGCQILQEQEVSEDGDRSGRGTENYYPRISKAI